MLKTIEILGVKITAENEGKILELLRSELNKPKKDRRKLVIFTPNPEQISSAAGNASLKEMLNSADINLPDGIGVIGGASLLGRKLEARIAGVDFMESLVKSDSKQPVVTGFFGGQPGVAIEAANCLQKIAPKMAIGYASDTFDKDRMIHSDIDILFVGLGFPKQEKWILAHKNEVPASIIMAVGGSLDFLSGRVPRAPKFVRKLGAEWLFRLTIQPWRIIRQARLLHFGGLILKEAVSNRLKNDKK